MSLFESDKERDMKKRQHWTEKPNYHNYHYEKVEYRPKKKPTLGLPIEAKKEEILNLIEKEQVVIISGETGCGKSTQVPQYLYSQYASKGQRCNIICTQPRRLAAINIAKRVAYEMGTQVGKIVGYQVGLNPVFSNETAILFVTTGIFLQRLIHEQTLNEFTHVILDEVHERDLNNDFSMAAVKYILQGESKVKIILMSATFDTMLFSLYFSPESIKNIDTTIKFACAANSEEGKKPIVPRVNAWDENDSEDQPAPTKALQWAEEVYHEEEEEQRKRDIARLTKGGNMASVVKIAEHKFKIDYYYLDELRGFGNIGKLPTVQQMYGNLANYFDSRKPRFLPECVSIAANLIVNIFHLGNYFKDKDEDKKTILVFVPGFAEIFELMQEIQEICPSEEIKKQLILLPLHSTIPDEEQSKIFNSVPKECRKIIIGTNIAESSITIPDLSCVIDFCLTKENYFNKFNNNEKLELAWASQASCTQRAGRAGRVADGEVYRLVPHHFYNHMQQFSTPEMRRSPLDKLILQIKTWNYKEPKALLGAAIEPPQLSDVEQAVRRLQDAGAITLPTSAQPTGQITFLGNIYCDMPCDIRVTRLCMFGLLFGCMKQAIIMASIIQQEKSLFIESQSYIDPIRLHRKFMLADPEADSDLIAYYNAYAVWHKTFIAKQEVSFPGFYKKRFTSEKGEIAWCRDQGLNLVTLKEAYRLIQELKDRFYAFGLNEELVEMDIDATCPKGYDKWTILKICIAGAFYPRYIKPHHYDLKIVKQEELKRQNLGFPTPHTILLTEAKDSDPHIVKNYFEQFGTIEKLERKETAYILEYTVASERKATLHATKLGSRNSKKEYIKPWNATKAQEEAYSHIRMLKVCSPYQVIFTNILDRDRVEIEFDSLHNGAIEYNTSCVHSNVYIAFDYYERRGKLLAKHITRISDIPMIDTLLVILFAPYITFIPDSTNTSYDAAIAQSQSYSDRKAQLHFTHWFSSVDLKSVNEIRRSISAILSNRDKVTEQRKIGIAEKVAKFLFTKRLLRPIYSRWDHLLYNPEEIKPHLDEYDIKTIDILSATKENQIILPPLKPLKIKEDRRLWTDEGKKALETVYNQIAQKKINLVKDFDRFVLKYKQKEAYVQCAQCRCFLFSLRNLEPTPTEKNYFRLKNSFCFDASKSIAENEKNDFVKMHQHFAEGWGQCANKHVFMLLLSDEFYVNEKSPVVIILPDLSELPWNSQTMANNFSDVFIKEKQIMEDRELSNENLWCPICEYQFNDPQNMILHSRSKQHADNLQEFLEI